MNSLTTDQSCLILLVATFLTHGLLLVNDGLYWDGWILNQWQQTKDWPTMKRFFREVGMPQLFLQHKLMVYLPGRIFWYNVLGFVSLYITALCIYLMGVQFASLTPFEALCLTLLVLCYPGQQMLVESVISLNYMLPVALFFSACWLGLYAEFYSGSIHWIYHGGSLFLFWLSFNMNSLLMYYASYLFLLFSYQITAHGFEFYQIGWFVIKHLDFIVLPTAFWWWKEKFTPRHGYYATYNRLIVTKQKTIDGFTQVLKQGLGRTTVDAIKYLLGVPLGRWLSGILCIISLPFMGGITLMPGPKAFCVIIMGVTTLIFAGLPYMWVGQPFSRRGWGTKNNILLALPFALLVSGAINLLLSPISFVLILCILLAASVVYLNYIYLCWMAVWAKNRSFLFNLNRISATKGLSIIGLCDQHPIRGSFDDGHPEHASAYLIYMFTYIWGDVRRLGIYEAKPRFTPYSAEEISAAIHSTTIDYGLTEINRRGSQGMLVINPGKHTFGEIETGLKYLFFRFFIRTKFSEFLEETTRVDFYPLWDPIITASPQTPFDSLMEKADSYMNNGDWLEALAPLKEALAMGLEPVKLYINIGFCLLNLNRAAESLPYFRRAAEMQPRPEYALALHIACVMTEV